MRCAQEITSFCADFLVERRGFEPLTISAPYRRSERDAAPLFGGPVRGVVNANGFISEVQTGQRLAAEGDALHEILDFLDIAAGPLLLEADELPAGLPVDLFGDVEAIQLGFVREV